jgi:hypothetical protein
MPYFLIFILVVGFYQANHEGTPIKDSVSLVKYAEPILFKIYSEKQIRSEKPYVVNLKNGIWTMDGTLPKGYKGGTFHIEIRERDGKLISVTHFK